MIKTILIIFAIFMTLAVIAMWVLSGSFARIGESAKGFPNLFRPGESGGSFPTFELPWKVSLPQGTNIENETRGWNDSQPLEEQVAGIEDELKSIEEGVRTLPPQTPPNASSW